jgi:hypothetical protein
LHTFYKTAHCLGASWLSLGIAKSIVTQTTPLTVTAQQQVNSRGRKVAPFYGKAGQIASCKQIEFELSEEHRVQHTCVDIQAFWAIRPEDYLRRNSDCVQADMVAQANLPVIPQ